MRILIVGFLAFLSYSNWGALAEPPLVRWISFAACDDPAYPNPWPEMRDLVVDNHGYIYGVGELSWEDPEAPWHGAVMIVKWDPQGNICWNHIYAHPDIYNHPEGAAIGTDGYLYVTGSRWPPSAEGYDWFISKISPDGELIDTRVDPDSGPNSSIAYYTVAQDYDGGLYLTGCGGWQAGLQAKYLWEADAFEWRVLLDPSPEIATHGRYVPGALYPGHHFHAGINVGAPERRKMRGLCLDSDGNVWFVEYGDGRICKFQPGQSPLVFPAPSSDIRDLAWDGSSIWCVDYNGILYELDSVNGSILNTVTTGLNRVTALSYNANENIFLIVANEKEIWKFDAVAATATHLFDGPISFIGGICASPDAIWVSAPSRYERNVYKLDPVTGDSLAIIRAPGTSPTGLQFDGQGFLWITDDGTDLIYTCSIDLAEGGFWGSVDVIARLNPLGVDNIEDSVIQGLYIYSNPLQGYPEFRHDFARQEQPMALATDPDGSLLAAIWHREENTFTITKLELTNEPQLHMVWEREVTFNAPYVFPTDITTDSIGNVYIIGRTSNKLWWKGAGEEDHIFTICLSNDGEELWRDIYDPGGTAEKESGRGGGVAVTADGYLYVGGTVSCEATNWKRSFVLIAYQKTLANTGATFRVSRVGDICSDGGFYGQSFETGHADIAEWIPISELVEPGDVIELDPTRPGYYRKARRACSALVAGVVSTTAGFVLGQREGSEGKALLALIGIVPVKVSDEGGPIQPGDLLVASATPGYAMRWDPDVGEPCGLVGKALESLERGTGVILVLLIH